MNETLGKIHFWGSFIFMNGIFGPMFIQGHGGRIAALRRDGAATYSHAQPVLHWNVFMSMCAFGLLIFQLPFIFNLFWSIRKGAQVGSNPWQATTLEWTAAPSPPVAHGNFPEEPVAYRGPYEYSVPGQETDYSPQNMKPVAAPQEG